MALVRWPPFTLFRRLRAAADSTGAGTHFCGFLGDLTSCSTAPDQAVSQHEESSGVLFQRYPAQPPYSTLTNDSTAMIGSRVVGSISYYLPRSLHRVSARYVGFAAYRNFKLDARFFVWIAEYPTAYFMVARSSSALSPQP